LGRHLIVQHAVGVVSLFAPAIHDGLAAEALEIQALSGWLIAGAAGQEALRRNEKKDT
jgi:hypothetical protein